MKAKNILFNIALGLTAISVFATSCDDMNSIQEEYAGREEQVYLTKVDSIKCYSGINEVKIVYWIGADPKIEQTVVYWNVDKDSLVKDFNRMSPGKHKDSLYVKNLNPGTYQFKFRNKNSRGESSLYSIASGIALAPGKEPEYVD